MKIFDDFVVISHEWNLILFRSNVSSQFHFSCPWKSQAARLKNTIATNDKISDISRDHSCRSHSLCEYGTKNLFSIWIKTDARFASWYLQTMTKMSAPKTGNNPSSEIVILLLFSLCQLHITYLFSISIQTISRLTSFRSPNPPSNVRFTP
jgi:hypothetical protein